MEEQNKFWRNQIKTYCFDSLLELEKTLNEFYKDRFVIATQIFPDFSKAGFKWHAVVYFKVSSADQEKAVAESKNE